MHKRTSQAASGTFSFILGAGLQVSGYQNVYLANACFAVAAILFIYLAVAVWPKARLISLPEAARLLYEEARKAGNVLAYAAERLGAKSSSENSEGRILDYMATHIARKLPVHGTRPPSKERELLDPSTGTFRNGASEFWESYSQSPTFVGLKVERSKLANLIAEAISDE